MDIVFGGILFLFGNILGGSLVYLLKTQIEHRLAIARIHETIQATAFNKAASEFRAAFAPAIVRYCFLTDQDEITNMLESELVEQGIGIERFRPYVRDGDEKAYQDAWENYHHSYKKSEVSKIFMRRTAESTSLIIPFMEGEP